MKYYFPLLFFLLLEGAFAQSESWQQHVSYHMDIDMNVKTYRYKGHQILEYTNNSPDTLKRVYYHLYPNAFQPGSEMDIRLQNIPDPDTRMIYDSGSKKHPNIKSRISKLSEDEIGYIHVSSLSQDGAKLDYKVEGTILEVTLAKPLLPKSISTFKMKFKAQVPVQIRRSGRNNKDGVALSMSQWYPKMAEYDFQGWHADPYIAREFYGIWGDFDVKITIDKNYVLGGTGYLQNPNEVGHGYQEGGKAVNQKRKKNIWHFIAPNVHDFTWAADPEYNHDIVTLKGGLKLHFLYKGTDTIVKNWKRLEKSMPKIVSFYNKDIGSYVWKQYSFIQGGDGGMEYAMCTLITGGRIYKGLESTAIHELAHSWFQHILATNETLHPWMDEGFTSYISSKAKNWLYGKTTENPYKKAYTGYNTLVKSGLQEPLTTHSDRYAYNFSYSVNAYTKGQIFLSQLGYIVGKTVLADILHKYYNDFKMKHPTPNDFIRVAEKVSNIHLGWYLNEWVGTTHNIDYQITKVQKKGDKSTAINLKRKGRMPMPLDVLIITKDGKRELYNIPLRMMRGKKSNFEESYNTIVTLLDWAWSYPNYSFEVQHPISDIVSVEIDPSGLMADVDRTNNIFHKND